MKIDGGCHCGAIAYEAEIDRDKIVVCHCTDCQTLSGSAFRTVAVTKEGTFKLLSGEPKVYVKIADSGAERAQAFCPECGSPIYAAAPGADAKVHAIRVGTARQRDALVPTMQAWRGSGVSWIDDLGSIKKPEDGAGVGR